MRPYAEVCVTLSNEFFSNESVVTADRALAAWSFYTSIATVKKKNLEPCRISPQPSFPDKWNNLFSTFPTQRPATRRLSKPFTKHYSRSGLSQSIKPQEAIDNRISHRGQCRYVMRTWLSQLMTTIFPYLFLMPSEERNVPSASIANPRFANRLLREFVLMVSPAFLIPVPQRV